VLKACVGLTAMAVTGMANATTFDFSATNLGLTGGNAYNTINTSIDGIGLTITALTIANDNSGNIDSISAVMGSDVGVYVSSSVSGNLGVRSRLPSAEDTTSDGNNLDGGDAGVSNDLDEGILFTFDRLVSLDYINFDFFTSSDDFNLTVDGANTSIVVDYNADSIANPLVTDVLNQFDEYRFNGIVGTSFLFWADGDSDSFRIDRLEVSAVPVPAAAWLFGSALLGMFGFSRRKKA